MTNFGCWVQYPLTEHTVTWTGVLFFRNFEKSEHLHFSRFGNLEVGMVQTKSEHLAGMISFLF